MATNKKEAGQRISNVIFLKSTAGKREVARSAEKVVEIAPRTKVEDEQADVYLENHKTTCGFNVMSDAPVSETFTVKEYRIKSRYAEAILDREYFSSMAKSPSHMIFLTGLVHTQKLLYMAMCKEFGRDYVPGAPEQLKVWPTEVFVDMPRMIRTEKDIVQKLYVDRIIKQSETHYIADIRTTFNDTVTISSRASIFLI